MVWSFGVRAQENAAKGLEPELTKPAERFQPAAPPLPVPLEGPLDAQHYTCGPGDGFELNFWGAQNFKLRATTDLEGKAFLPRIGYVPVSGKTLADVRATVRKAVQRHFPGLNFELSLIEPRTFLVHLVDNVSRPGLVRATQVERLSSVIERAGGVTAGGSRRRIQIRHRDGRTQVADLVLYAQTGRTEENPFLLDGDVVHVPFEALTASITGGVNRPGRYELVASKDFDELFSIAGGYSTAVTRELPLTLVRRDEKGRSILRRLEPPFPGRDVPKLPIEQGDSIDVPTIAQLEKTVLLVGAIQGAISTDESTALKRLVFAEGDTVRTLVLRAGGVLTGADLPHAALVHENGSVDDVDLDALLVQHNAAADRPVSIGDTLMVPFKRRSVIVEGAVFRPGSYPYNPRFALIDYVGAAGGPTRFARSLKESHLITADGQTKALSDALRVNPGDIVVVPERDFSRPEIVQLVLSATGLLLGAATIAIALHR